MAERAFELLYEIKGKVKWFAPTTISQSNRSLPGKLCLFKTENSFYIQCFYDHGKTSKKYRLDINQVDNARLVARARMLTLYIPFESGTRFFLQDADESEVETFMLHLDDIKRRVTSKYEATKPENIQGIPRVETLMGPATGTPSSSLKAHKARLTSRQANRQNTQQKTTTPMGKASPNAARALLSVPQTPNSTPKISRNVLRTPTSVPQTPSPAPRTSSVTKTFMASVPNNQSYKGAVSEGQNKKVLRTENDLEKENIDLTLIQSPEKRKTPGKRSPSAFGTPLKKQPLQENETSPKLSRPETVKAFYGSNNTGIRTKRNVSTSSRRRSLFNTLTSSSPASPAALQFSTSSTVTKKPFNFVKTSSPWLFQTSEITSQGFTNLGNTCYMNVILQSILGLVPFVRELDNKDIVNSVSKTSLYNAMYNLYLCKNDNGGSIRKKNALERVKQSLTSSELTKRFRGDLQNDAHEFMNICLDQMKEEVQNTLGEKLETVAAKVCPVRRNFEGSLRKYIRCKGCEDLVTKDELFNNLSLHIPTSGSSTEFNLSKLLECFFRKEKLDRTCEKCECKDAVQDVKLRTLPRVIILHLLRSQLRADGENVKNSKRIHVDRFLNLGSFCTSDISGPPPFILKKASPSKTHFVENETPSTDEDFVLAKPRRRLDMSAAVEPLSYGHKEAETKAAAAPKDSKESRNYPEWVEAQSQQTDLLFNYDSSDENDRSLAELVDGNEEEWIRCAINASLKENKTNSFEEDEFERAKKASLETKQREDLRSRSFTFGTEDASNDDIIGMFENIERCASDADCYKGLTKEQKDLGGNNGHKGSEENRKGYRRMGRSINGDVEADNEVTTGAKLYGGTRQLDGQEWTPSKRRKVEESLKRKASEKISSSSSDEDREFKRAVELSKKEHNLKDWEQSQMEEAIKLSLANDTVEAPLTYMVVEDEQEEPEDPEDPEENEAKEIPSGDINYRLVSVVSHMGTKASWGHYISDVYEVQSDQWIRYNDVTATKIKEHVVRYDKSCDGYIYFYMHRSCIDLLKDETKAKSN